MTSRVQIGNLGQMKVAIVYDRVNKWGGAERLLLVLHRLFPKAPLYTSVYDPNSAKWAKVFPVVHTSFLQHLPLVKNHHEWVAWLMPLAFWTLNLSGYDLVISVTSEFAKGIRVKGSNTKHLCICLTPTRYLWSHYTEYFKSKWFRVASYPGILLLRLWDKKIARQPDVMIAISSQVQKRIKKYYDRESQLVFPPVVVKRVSSKKSGLRSTCHSLKNYYLVVSRLVPYKQVELVVSAFNKLQLPLVIVGAGSQEKKLRQLAKPNIIFAGFVNEGDLKKYYQNAKAFIMPQHEDFGLAAVEAQGFGVPTIAYKAGGALDFVTEGKTGVLFNRQTARSLITAVEKSRKIQFNKYAMIKNTERFSEGVFCRQIIKIINQL